MNKKDNLIQTIQTNNSFEKYIENQIESNSAILDISILPFFHKILEADRKTTITIYIPDTIKKLVLQGEQNRQYYFYLTKLISRWTTREVDINFLHKIMTMKEEKFREEYKNIKLQYIDFKDYNEIIYNSCIENIIEKEFLIELSPEFNVLGDVIGKILGAAQKLKLPVLMVNRRLMIEARKAIPVLDAANIIVQKKMEFFESLIPGLRRTRGMKFFIGVIVGHFVSPLGYVLTVLDP